MSDRLKMIQDMLKKEPNDDFLNYAAALELSKMGKQKEAISTLGKLKENHPDYLPTYYQLGKLLVEQNDLSQATTVLEEGYQLALKLNEDKTAEEIKAMLEEV